MTTHTADTQWDGQPLRHTGFTKRVERTKEKHMKHGAANIFTHAVLVADLNGAQAEINGKWVPARPLGLQGFCLRHRLKCAWLAFMGKCDLVRWAEGQ